MKVLFVCEGNVSRSQMAEAIYNHYSHSSDASSAGTDVGMPGETMGDRKKRIGASNTVDLMQKVGLDISDCKQNQLEESMLKNYGRVINMCDESIAPGWLMKAPNYTYWKVKDPKGADMPFFVETFEKIKKRVLELIAK